MSAEAIESIVQQILPTVPDESTLIGRYTKIVSEYIYIDEPYVVEGPLCVVVANFAPGDPDIVGIINPSGSTKTEILRMFGKKENEYIYPISNLTEHTFISGFDASPDCDIVPNLKGRIIIIKDLTTILSRTQDSRAAIFADFRDLTDGYMDKKFGKKIHKTYDDIHSSILFACTNSIERYYALYSSLGQRMLFMRPSFDIDKASAKAEENEDCIDQIRETLYNTTMEVMEEALSRLREKGLPEMTPEQKAEMKPLYKFLAIARTNIFHTYSGDIGEIPEPELPTRITKSVSRLCRVHALLGDQDYVTIEDLDFGKRIIKDNIPTMRFKILKVMTDENDSEITIAGISHATKLPYSTTKKELNDLIALGIVIRESDDRGLDLFYVDSEYEDLVKELCLLD